MTLQNNFTTPEQSKRLLELGVPVNSADCTRNLKTGLILAIPFEPSVFKERKEFWLNAYPCWSVGRLMEIIDICVPRIQSDTEDKEYPSTIEITCKMGMSYVEYLVWSIVIATKARVLDFSKLEEQE